jgi:AraC family ethanolamine operon transcriptional activator
VRLNGTRRAIKTSASETEAATLWGFWHFGRFAQDYKVMFGEFPSGTFRRHHSARRLT